MRVLMFGWEFPPHISGGLGTACYGIAKGLTGIGTEILFVLPRVKERDQPPPAKGRWASDFFQERRRALPRLKNMEIRVVQADMRPYGINVGKIERRPISGVIGRRSTLGSFETGHNDGSTLYSEVERYSLAAGVMAAQENFDVIHGHDWMTVQAAVEARRVSGRPFVFHVHSLESDRSGEHIDRRICDIERQGLERSDHIISVSDYTKRIIVEKYGIIPDKITVVHNAVTRHSGRKRRQAGKKRKGKTVLFLGRITYQKGPDYFIEAAAKVLTKVSNVRFVMAGSGDMMPRMIDRVAELGIGRHFHFTGFLRGEDVARMYSMSDLYVMPSVSEPFGIAALEAALCGVPVIIPRQSGVAEILRHALEVDAGDIQGLADKMVAVLSNPALASTMVKRSREDLRTIRWENAADRIHTVYSRLCG